MNKKKNLKKIFAASLTLVAGISLVSCRDSKVKNYTVSFLTDGGTVYNDTTITKGKTVDLNQYAPTKDGYVFEGWYTDDAFTTAFTSETKVTGDLTLYAKWAKAINVTFESNGGTAVSKAVVAKGKTVTRPADPTKEAVSSNHKTTSYTFAGWYTDEELETEYNFSTAVEADFKLYAKWTESVAIDEGYESYQYIANMDTFAEQSFDGNTKLNEDVTMGIITVEKNVIPRTRGGNWTKSEYPEYDNLDLSKTNDNSITKEFTHSVKLDTSAGIVINGIGKGVIKLYLSNGSSSSDMKNSVTVKKSAASSSETTTTIYEFPGKSGQPIVQLCLDIETGDTIQVLRTSEKTVDVYAVEVDLVTEALPVTDIAIETSGTQVFTVGQEFNANGLVVKGIKENGIEVTLSPDQYTVSVNATDFSQPGEYTVTVSYGDVKKTYTVTVVDLAGAIDAAKAALDVDYPASNYTAYATEISEAKSNASDAYSAATSLDDLNNIIASQKELLDSIPTEATILAATKTYTFDRNATASDTIIVWDGTSNSNGLLTLVPSGTTYDNNNSVQAKDGDLTITFNVKAGTEVTFKGYQGYSEYKVDGRYAPEVYSKYYGADTTVTIIVTSGKYFVSVKINPYAKGTTEEATVTSLDVEGQNIEFAVGTPFVAGSLIVKSVYSDNTYLYLLSTDYTIDSSNVDPTNAGEYNVIIKYNADDTITKTYKVTYAAELDYTVRTDTTYHFRSGQTTNLEEHFYAFGTASTSPFYGLTITNAASNAGDWLTFDDGAGVSFEVGGNSTLTINTYKQFGGTVKLGDTVLTAVTSTGSEDGKYVYTYSLIGTGTVTISSTDASNYLGYISVDFA